MSAGMPSGGAGFVFNSSSDEDGFCLTALSVSILDVRRRAPDRRRSILRAGAGTGVKDTARGITQGLQKLLNLVGRALGALDTRRAYWFSSRSVRPARALCDARAGRLESRILCNSLGNTRFENRAETNELKVVQGRDIHLS